jgi:hypothetical protein
MTITTRAGKGSALTHAELDANFTDLGLAHGDTSVDLNVDQVDATTVNATDVNATDVNATDVNATGDIISGSIKARGILAISDPAVGAVDNHQFRLSVDETDPDTPKLKIEDVHGGSSTVREYIEMYNGVIKVSEPMLINKSTALGLDPKLQVEGTQYDSFNVMRTGKTGSSPYSTALYLTEYTDAGHTPGQGTGYWTQVKTNDGTANTGAVISKFDTVTDVDNYKSRLDFQPVTNNGGSLSFATAFSSSHDENVSWSPLTLKEGTLTFTEVPASGAFSNMIKGYDYNGGSGITTDYIELGKESNAFRRVEMKQMFVTHKVADISALPSNDIASGSIVFDESDNTFYGYNGTSWVAFH